jgi:SAM-dependent methyltransferase
MNQPDPYTGVANLEVMQEAVRYNRFLLNLVLKHAPAYGAVMDFGAGGGEFAKPVAARRALTAVEPDAFLRSQLASRGIHAVENATSLPDATFEYVYTLNVLEHIDDDMAALRSIHDKLTTRGKLLVYVPAFPVLYSAMDSKVGHVRRYTRGDLTSKVTAAGFVIETVEYVDCVGFLASLFFKAVSNSSGDLSARSIRIYDRLAFPLSRALDGITKRLFGKNLLVVAHKKSPPGSA